MQAIVLSRRDFREYDQIVSVFTKEAGKLELLARGVKKITSKNSAHLEPFSFVEIEVAKGKEIDHLTKVHPVEYFGNIRQDLQKSFAAGYIVFLTNQLVQVGERDVALFEALKSWLYYVDGVERFNRILIDCYIVTLLHCLGFSASHSSDFDLKFKETLTIMESGNWEAVNKLGYNQELHKKIYEFLIYHSERGVVDFQNLAKFRGIL